MFESAEHKLKFDLQLFSWGDDVYIYHWKIPMSDKNTQTKTNELKETKFKELNVSEREKNSFFSTYPVFRSYRPRILPNMYTCMTCQQQNMFPCFHMGLENMASQLDR